MAASPPPGWLCHSCAKSSGADPYKKAPAPRKRKTPGDKRNVVSYEERRFPSLVSVCIQVRMFTTYTTPRPQDVTRSSRNTSMMLTPWVISGV